MAHVFKRVKARVNKCVEAALELQGTGANDAENAAIDLCIEALRRVQAEVYAKLQASEESLRRPRGRPVAVPPAAPPAAAVKPPVYGPSTGVYMAPAEGMKGAAAQIIESERDVMRMAKRGDAATEVAEILAGNLGTGYECDAAKTLSLNPAWEFWTPEERLAAIEDKGRQLEDADDTDYFADTKPAAGDAAAV